MPSLWKWLSKGRHKIDLSKKQENNEKTEDRYKRTEYFTPNTGSKDDISSKNLPSDIQSSFINEQPRLGNVSPKSEVIGSVPKDEKEDKARKEQGLKHDSDASKGRIPAYKIFGDEYKPTRIVNKDRGNYKSSSGRDDSPGFPQEKQLFPSHQEKQLFPSHQEKQLFPSHQEKQLFPSHQEKENVDVVGVEMRQKIPELFGGLASRLHRHSLQMALPGHGSDIKVRPEFIKSETMAGYVPKAVSLHDASAILSGRATEETVPPKHVNSKVYYLPNPRDSRPRFAYVIPHYIPSPSNQRNEFLIPREHPKNSNHYVSTNIKQAPRKNNQLGKSYSPSLNNSRKVDSNVKSSSSNENFYFSSLMLGNFTTGYKDVDSLPSEGMDSLASRDFKEQAAKSGVPLGNSVSELSIYSNGNGGKDSINISDKSGKDSINSSGNGGKDSINISDKSGKNSINSSGNGGKDSISSINNVLLKRTDSVNSQDLSTGTDHDRTGGSNEIEDGNISDEDVSSVLARLEQVINNNSDPSDYCQLEVIFNAEGDVLY